MKMADGLVQELQTESQYTRKTLERTPTAKFDYKPHEKSMTMQQLASHLAEIPGWGAMTFEANWFDLDTKTWSPFAAADTEELLGKFDEGMNACTDALSKASDEDMMAMWTMTVDGKTAFKLPRVAVVRGMIMNHMVHHRAQLGVYLRMNDLPVPSIYGPSADEQG